MQNLLEIQNALRSAPDQQLMALMQGANPTVPQWAVASELNNRKEMRDEQTRQQGLGQPTVLAQLTGAAPAPTPQTNVAGMPQGVASGMAQSMAPKTNVNQNTGINTVARNANVAAPVATMASGGILKMQDGGDPTEKTYTFIYPEGMNTPPFELGISDLDEYDAVIKAIRKLGGTIVETDTGRVMQSDTAKKILQESSDVAEADARVPKYVPSASDLYDTDSGRFKSENATPENYVVSAGLPPVGGAMYSSPTGGQGGSTDSSDLGLPTGEFSGVPLSAKSRPKGLATLGAAGDADMLDETIGVQTAPSMPASPGIAAGTPFSTTKYTPRLSETPAKAIQTGVDDKGRGIFIPSLEETQLDNLRGRSGVGAFSKVPFNATSDEAAKESVNQATLANNARDGRVARVTSDGPGTELAETVGRIAPKADEPQQLRFINDILNRDTDEAAADVAEVTTDPYAEDVVANNRIRFMPNEAVGGGVEAQDLSSYITPKTNAEKTTTLPTTTGNDALDRRLGLGKYSNPYRNPILDDVLTQAADTKVDKTATPYQDAVDIFTGRAAADSLNTNGPFMPNEDTRIKRMKALAEQINSGELTGNSLLSAQKTLERLRKGVVRSYGEEELENYLANQITGGVKKALPYAVDTADYIVRNLGLGTLAGATLGPRAEGFLLDMTDAAQANTEGLASETPTSANEVAAEAIASSVSKGDLTGPKPSGSVSLGAAITDSQKEQAAINAAQGIDELSFLNNDSNAEVQRRAGLYKNAFTEQDAINAELERKKAEAALAAAVGPVPSPADAPMPFSKDSTDSAEQFYNNLPLFDQSVKNGKVVTPATPTGIATVNPMANRASDSPSSYEQKLLDILAEREKSADQDKWLGLAEMGMRLMASSNPNMLSAIGEAGLGASQTFLGNKRKAEAQEMDVLSKLSALEARKQIADDANRTRLEAARISRSGRSPAGSYASVNAALSGIKAQITAIEGSMPATPPTDSRALDAYNKQLETLSSLREQEKRLMSTNPVVASIFANVDGTNTPAAVDLS